MNTPLIQSIHRERTKRQLFYVGHITMIVVGVSFACSELISAFAK